MTDHSNIWITNFPTNLQCQQHCVVLSKTACNDGTVIVNSVSIFRKILIVMITAISSIKVAVVQK